MNVVVTGADGFLGWHTRLRLDAVTTAEVVPVGRARWNELPQLMHDADAVIHIAGVNRGAEADVVEGNLAMAHDLAAAVEAADRPVRIVYANPIQVGHSTSYGRSKVGGADRLAEAARSTGGRLVDVRLPNLFGEHGRPHCNSFVATFAQAVIEGTEPNVQDRELELLHAQRAAQALLLGLTTDRTCLEPGGMLVSVREVYDLLHEFDAVYRDTGEIPDLSSELRIDLFNTYRAALGPSAYPIPLSPRDDERGRFVEVVRSRRGESQTSFSTTLPGVTRGEHYHLRKIERFVVLQGQGRMSLRRAFTRDVVRYDVTGEAPVAVDMPVGWVHNITNTGQDVMLTAFWAHEPFRAEAPDTYPQKVCREWDA